MTNFEKITASPEALGEFLAARPAATGPWDGAFHREFWTRTLSAHRRKGKRTIVFFCHPYSAYERGSNENMNRLIRRFFPKGTNFDDVTKEQVEEAERWINNYPRRLLDWRSAADLFDEELQAA